MSLGSYAPSTAERQACYAAYKRGVTIVAAAGNFYGLAAEVIFGIPVPVIGYPAGYDECVIAVGATDYESEKTYYSDYGASMDFLWYGRSYGNGLGLDLMAPGGDTAADLNGDGYPDGVLQQTLGWKLDPIWGDYVIDPLNFVFEEWAGTSMACPHVAGVAALLASRGVTAPDQIRAVLESTATDLNITGWDQETGWGLVNAEAAVLTTVQPPNVYNEGPTANAGPDQIHTDSDCDGYEYVVLDGSGSTWTTGFPIISYQWRENGVLLAEGVTATVRMGVGQHTIALTCIDSMGMSDTDTVLITVNAGLPIMRVLSVDVIDQQKWTRHFLSSTVTVVNASGNPVPSALVSGAWSGDYSGTARPTYTNSQGQATFTVGLLRPGTYTFTVTNVTRSGWIYRPDLNSETSETRTFY
jgi:hypothetical protein